MYRDICLVGILCLKEKLRIPQFSSGVLRCILVGVKGKAAQDSSCCSGIVYFRGYTEGVFRI